MSVSARLAQRRRAVLQLVSLANGERCTDEGGAARALGIARSRPRSRYPHIPTSTLYAVSLMRVVVVTGSTFEMMEFRFFPTQ